MKIKLFFSALFMLALSGSLLAQSGRMGQRGQMGERIKAELNLDDTQESAWNAINEKYMSSFQELRQDGSLSQEEKRSQMMALRSDWENEIQGILNEDQLATWNRMQEEGQARRMERSSERQEKAREMAAELSEKAKTELDLTDEQTMQWEALNKTYGEKQKAVLQDESLSKEEKQGRMAAIQAEKKEELAQILNEEQMEKWDAIKEEEKAKYRDRNRSRQRTDNQ
jgi:endonuclease/exonuclease/phosphatase (EEP) superfamily protein YafD